MIESAIIAVDVIEDMHPGRYVYVRDIRQTPKESSAMNEEVSVRFLRNIQAETLHLM